MIPAKFDYVRARTVDEAFAGLADPEARVIAGGHSLLPMMKLRLAFPSVLVDIAGLDWRGVEEEPGHISVGALSSYDDLLRSRIVEQLGCLSDSAARVGDVQIRNAGTIGGGLAHADPASDITAATIALEAELVLASARGTRRVGAADFFTGPFTTGLEHARNCCPRCDSRSPSVPRRLRMSPWRIPHRGIRSPERRFGSEWSMAAPSGAR